MDQSGINDARSQSTVLSPLAEAQMLPLGSYAYLRPKYLKQSAWIEHIPFAFWLTEALRPSLMVELGAHWGTSYFAFCQALEKLDIGAQAFAVDHWTGDEHAGNYGEEVYQHVRDYNENNYGFFSTLIKQNFDDANKHFLDGSIDVLHIDGFHSYEAVKNDFDKWLPKMSGRGVVLLHDTNVRERNFGVFRLFEELRGKYPVFEFFHGHGLGVVGVGGQLPETLQLLLDAELQKARRRDVQHLFASLGKACLDSYHNKELHQRGVRVTKLEKELGEQKNAVQEAQRKNASLTTELHKMLGEVQVAIAARNDSDAEIRRLREELGRKEEIIMGIDRSLSDTKLAHRELAAVVSEREIAIRNLEEKLSKQTQYMEAAQQSVVQVGVEAADLRNRLAEVTSALLQRQIEIEQKADENSDLRRELAIASDSQIQNGKVAEALKDHVDLLLRDVGQLRDTQSEDKERSRAQLRTINELNDVVSKATAELTDAKAAREKQIRQYGSLESAKAESDVLAQERLGEVTALTKMLMEMEDRASVLTLRCEEARRELGRAVMKTLELPSFWRILPRRLYSARQIKSLKRSGLFDPEWYRKYYADIETAGVDPLRHYIQYGADEGRFPNGVIANIENE